MDPVDAARLQNFETMTPVGSLSVAGYPIEPNDVTNKQYVDERIASVIYTAGTGVLVDSATRRISIDPVQTGITQVGTLTGLAVSGTSSMQQISLNGNKIVNMALPILPTDGASKAYADSNYISGLGIVKTGLTFATDVNQSHVTSVGTLTSLTVTGSTKVPTPVTAGEAANKGYVDSAYIMSGGLTKTGMTVSIDAAQPNITSLGTLTGITVAGPAFLQGGADLQGWSIINMSDPVDPTDGANRRFVESYFQGGSGISVSGGVVSINAAQPNITSLGTLTNLSISGTPTNGDHATNKNYVDNCYLPGAGLTKSGTTFSVGNSISVTTLTVSGATTVRNPQTAMEAATKSYVDGRYTTSGPGLNVDANGVFTMTGTLPPLNSLTVNGAVTLAAGADVNGSSIINVGDPVDDYDVATKIYCDTRYTGGTGITVTNGVIALAANATIANLTVTGSATVPTPTAGTHVANKTYVDGSFRAGSGLNLSNGSFAVTPNQPNITTLGTLTSLNVLGSVTLQSGADMNGSSIINVGQAFDPDDAISLSFLQSYFSAGTGLTLTNQRFSVNNALPNVTSVGTLTSLTVTGATNFPVPTTASSVATKGYCDGAFSASTGLNLTSGAFSILPAQPTITSVGTLTSLTVSGRVTISSAPTLATDAANKSYVDTAYSASTGLTKVGTMFSVNASQPQITEVGTLDSLEVIGATLFQSGCDFNGSSCINLGSPFDPTDAATKEYVDLKEDFVNLKATGVIATPFQVSTPTSGQNLTVGNVTGLCISGSGTLAALTITFPSTPADGRRLIITSLVNITALTIGNATIRPTSPTSMTAGQPLRFVYVSSLTAWVPM